MPIIIGSARSDENGKYNNGTSGDQRQTTSPDYKGEVSMQNFYNHSKGWYVLRPKNPSDAVLIASCCVRACNNPNIGYDQDGRYGILKCGTDSTAKTECDCSSLVRQCIKEATGIDVGDFYTGNEADVLEKSGLFEKRISYTSMTELFDGDVLVTKSKGHTVIVCSGNPRKDKKKYTVGWNKDTKGWWYADSETSYLHGTWADINHHRYYFDNSGYAVTGRKTIDGKKYFFEDEKDHKLECALCITDKDGAQTHMEV